MAYNILLTSLSAAETDLPVRYFFARNKSGFDYCDALMDTEASIKTMLSRYDIDGIIVIGGKGSYDKGDELNPVSLSHGSTLNPADKASLSTYALLQHRIAKFVDNLTPDQAENDTILPQEARDKLIRFIRDFQDGNPGLKTKEPDLLFDELSKNGQICEEFWSALFEACPELCDLSVLIRQWVKSYLYAELNPSLKMQLLPSNKEVRLRFIPEAKLEDGGQWVESMMAMKKSIIEDQEDINLYISLNSDDAADTFVVLNMLDIMVTMPGSGVQLKKIFTLRSFPRRMTGIIRDDTGGFGITELFHGIRSFLNYGKADIIEKIWNKSGGDDEQIADMVYAMRDVDIGLSMCNIPLVENGILRLRDLFESEEFWRASGSYGMQFSVIAESIREDYGALLEGDGDIPLIDLVKWAYRHQFYQQTLTLIESKAPDNLVKTGIFYYCDDEKHEEQVTRLFAEQRMALRPQEYFKIDDIEHYFIKTYDRGKPRGKGEDQQRLYAALRTQSVKSKDSSQIKGYTVCDNLETLEDILYAYYHVGDVRNKIAHAEASKMNAKQKAGSKSSGSSSLAWMKDSIDLFIESYEKALAQVEDKNPNVIIISSKDVQIAAENMRGNNPPKKRYR